MRKVEEGAITIGADAVQVPKADNPAFEEARKGLLDCITASCGVPLSQALEIQAKHSAGFMLTKLCHKGVIGSTYGKVMKI